jgi:hypothetical protein
MVRLASDGRQRPTMMIWVGGRTLAAALTTGLHAAACYESVGFMVPSGR